MDSRYMRAIGIVGAWVVLSATAFANPPSQAKVLHPQRSVTEQDRLNRALIAAIKANDAKTVLSVLQQGADANCRDEPPRKFSLLERRLQVARGRKSAPSHAPTPLLLIFGGITNRKEGPPPPGDPSIVQALLEHGAHTEVVDDAGQTPLLLATMWGYERTARLLMRYNANVNVQARDMTPWMWEALVGDGSLLKPLLDRGVNINFKNSDGDTALIMAIWDDSAWQTAKVAFLLAHGADVSVKGMYARTPLSLARARNEHDIVRLLKAAGAKN